MGYQSFQKNNSLSKSTNISISFYKTLYFFLKNTLNIMVWQMLQRVV